MIGRRAALGAAAATAFVEWRARAQEAGRVYRIGHFGVTERSEQLTRDRIVPELETLGFVLGRNLVIEGRHGSAAELPRLAREILLGRPDVIVAIGAQALRAMSDTTTSVPIVMFADDPVAMGVAASLARPGGNVTGVANMVVDLQAKRLDLLREALPSITRVGALLKAISPTRAKLEAELAASAARAGLALTIAYADDAGDFPAAFEVLRAAGVQATVIGPDPQFYAAVDRLVALAGAARLALSCEWPDMARAGCLIGYGTDQLAMRARLAQYVARILRGANAGDLPIEQPTVFELVLNLRTARSLGVAVPPALLARADEVIE
ncbi:MAG: ABC transporter substrate-binding protein [Alphaproteobacteria bacterium]|nr:ABC transporter substrate-binding protein [Alphaproteobacteria bacterium]